MNIAPILLRSLPTVMLHLITFKYILNNLKKKTCKNNVQKIFKVLFCYRFLLFIFLNGMFIRDVSSHGFLLILLTGNCHDLLGIKIVVSCCFFYGFELKVFLLLNTTIKAREHSLPYYLTQLGVEEIASCHSQGH